MRLNSKFAALAFTTAAAACGGGSNPPPVIIDSPDPVDSPPAVTCPADVIPGLQLMGTMKGKVYITPDAGQPNEGVLTFLVGAGLPTGANGSFCGASGMDPCNPSGNDALFIEAVTPIANGIAKNFTSDANATTYAAASFVFGNLAGGNADSFSFASNGSVTFTANGSADNDVNSGMVAATNYREVDDAGADVAGGCTVAMMGLDFTITHNGDNMFQAGGVATGGNMNPLSDEQFDSAMAAIRKFRTRNTH